MKLRLPPVALLLIPCFAGLVSCSDNNRLSSELNELNAQEMELTTASSALAVSVNDSHRKLGEIEKSLRGNDRELLVITDKAARLKQRLQYLQSAVQSANEQSDALNTETTKYKQKYLK
jgi:outer membrane murein-binding lipoprotein Lpp